MFRVFHLGWSTCRATETFVAGWRNAARWLVDLLGVDPRQAASLMKNEQESQDLLLKVNPRSSFRNNFLQTATRIFVARQVHHARWSTRHIGPKRSETMLGDKLRLLYAVFRCLKVLTFFCHCYSFCSMFLDRHHRRRRWIVGCVMVSIAVITMLLAPPPSVVSVVLFQDSLCMFRVVLSHTSGEANLNIICSWLFFHIGEHCSALRWSHSILSRMGCDERKLPNLF